MTDRSLLRSLRILLPLGGALISSAVGLAAYVVHALNGPRRPTWRDNYTFTPFEVDVTWEKVEFQSDDGITLRGWWFPRPESRRIVVGLTGHKGGKHELLGIGSGLWRAGNNVLLFDFRGCGDSDSAPLSLAHKELADARAAVAYAQHRVPQGRIGFMGFSMGAAVGILEAAANPTVRAVVADSSFASMSDVVAAAFRRYRLPAGMLVAMTDLLNRWRHGYPFGAVRPVDVVPALSPRPLFIIHGADDRVTPVEHARRLYAAAAEPKELWISDGTPHCGTYFVDRERYVGRVAEFFEMYL
jgi:fermentation-respiration switch protein FrsA (DUF1100 family)